MRPSRSGGKKRPGELHVKVHERGDRRLDGILGLIEEAARPQPLPQVLAALCARIASVFKADVASVYVKEPDESVEGGAALVMRANIGFPASAVGSVRLLPGEGLTGFVAECLRPVSVDVGQRDERYKHVPGLGEERFPSYLGVPLLSGGGTLGVLVLQRREAREFGPAEVALATALAAPVAFAIERAAARSAEHQTVMQLPTRSVRLDGVAVAPGSGLGRVAFLPQLDEARLLRDGVRPGDAVHVAAESLARDLDRSARHLERQLDGAALRQLRALAPILEDRRLRDLMVTYAGESGVATGLSRVARHYAGAQYRMASAGAPSDASDAWHAERVTEIEDLCLLTGLRALGVLFPAPGSVLVSERLSAFLTLACGRRIAGVVLGGSATSEVATALLRAAGVPALAEVAGLFAWARPGDRLLVDGDAGLARLNPPATAVARHRARQRA